MPKPALRARLIANLKEPAATVARRTGQRIARAADATNCAASETHVYWGYGRDGNQTWYGAQLYWANFSSSFNNHTSSYWSSNFWDAAWHDGPFGASSYYGYATRCWPVSDSTPQIAA